MGRGDRKNTCIIWLRLHKSRSIGLNAYEHSIEVTTSIDHRSDTFHDIKPTRFAHTPDTALRNMAAHSHSPCSNGSSDPAAA
eukprot:CAMPEP_0178999026 /NCGR_PEP_ID=MMETSP0795-20121207/9827_1 /TAXON_ID=88552 /ORGANISM="Amoebophrya sp., Strain Ameob2" /LENGTH=81 /DNA_ID=CAMNT_0020691745 /DNA_START=45 /DNA_END=287 /DNA_ORIENTATION=+